MKLNQKPMFLIQSPQIEALCSVMDSFRQQHITDYMLGARDTKIIKASSCSVGYNSPVRTQTRRHRYIDACRCDRNYSSRWLKQYRKFIDQEQVYLKMTKADEISKFNYIVTCFSPSPLFLFLLAVFCRSVSFWLPQRLCDD